MTVHENSMAYDESTPVAQWHAHTCKAVVWQQAVQAPCTRHSLTACWAPFRSPTSLSPLRWFSSVLTIATIGELAPLKMHS